MRWTAVLKHKVRDSPTVITAQGIEISKSNSQCLRVEPGTEHGSSPRKAKEGSKQQARMERSGQEQVMQPEPETLTVEKNTSNLPTLGTFVVSVLRDT